MQTEKNPLHYTICKVATSDQTLIVAQWFHGEIYLLHCKGPVYGAREIMRSWIPEATASNSNVQQSTLGHCLQSESIRLLWHSVSAPWSSTNKPKLCNQHKVVVYMSLVTWNLALAGCTDHCPIHTVLFVLQEETKKKKLVRLLSDQLSSPTEQLEDPFSAITKHHHLRLIAMSRIRRCLKIHNSLHWTAQRSLRARTKNGQCCFCL